MTKIHLPLTQLTSPIEISVCFKSGVTSWRRKCGTSINPIWLVTLDNMEAVDFLKLDTKSIDNTLTSKSYHYLCALRIFKTKNPYVVGLL